MAASRHRGECSTGRGQEAGLREPAASFGIDGQVRFYGLTDDAPKVLKAIDVMAPSSFREGLVVAVVEAQAADIPCAISKKCSLKQL